MNLLEDGRNFGQTTRDTSNCGEPSNCGIGIVAGVQNVGSTVFGPPWSSLASRKK
jgi:hypothetical protein|tara:strand:+ start:450 stop:614 length:165 start_codon:yes stop_codon:yes gene_type:complete